MTDREDALIRECDELRRERDKLQAALAEKPGGPSMGRALANARATQLEAERDRLRTALETVLPMVGAPHDYTIGDVWAAQKQAQHVLNEAATTDAAAPGSPSPDQPPGGGAPGRDESIPAEIIPWLLKEADEWEPSGETYEKGYRSPTAEMLRSAAAELTALRDVAEAAEKAVAQADLFDEPEPHPDDMRLAIINIGDWLHAALDALAEAPDDKE